MFKKFESSLLLLTKLLMFCLCAAVFFLIYGQKYAFLLIPTRTSIVTLGVFAIMYMAMTVIYGGFDIGKRKSKPIINSLILSVLFTDIVAHFFMCIMNVTIVHNGKFAYEYPLLLLAVYIVQVFLIILMSYTCNDLYFSFKKPQNCIIVTRIAEPTEGIIAKVGRYKKQYNITKVVYINQPDIF